MSYDSWKTTNPDDQWLGPESDYSAGYADADKIEDTMREIGNELFAFRAKIFTKLARLNENVPIGRLSPAAIDASLTAWFHDEIQARLNELAAEAEEGWQ